MDPLTTSDIVNRRTLICACGKKPVWVKLRRGTVMLACPTTGCKLYLAVKGRNIFDAIETWNREVDQYGRERRS